MRLPKLTPLTGIALTALVLLGGCKRASQTAPAGDTADRAPSAAAAPLSTASLSEAERRYGVSPTLNKNVEYQPDVIIMEHGAQAIRSQSSDGFTWTIDAEAQGASEIKVDKILFATGRVVGRVLKVEHQGGDVKVTLGPMELTDVIKEAHIEYSSALDPTQMLVYVAPPDYPGTFEDRDVPESKDSSAANAQHADKTRIRVYTVSSTGELRPLHEEGHGGVSCVAGTAEGSLVQTAYRGCDEGPVRSGNFRYVNTAASGGIASDIAAVLINGFSIVPDVSKGLGATIRYPLKNGMHFLAHANLRLENPKFTFHLNISNGGVNTATVELSGVGGIDVGIEGGTNGEFKNVDQVFAIPVDISFPMPTLIPFAATFHQSILVKTDFTAKQAVIRANGDYKLTGSIIGGVINGQPSGKAPLFVEATQNLAHSLSGESLGVNAIVLGYGGKLIVGIGGYGFVVGPWASVNTSVGITRGSDAQTGLVGYTCRSAIFDFSLKYGLGWAIPSWSANLVNSFFSIFHAKPIRADYGLELGTIPIKSQSDAVPPSCADKPA